LILETHTQRKKDNDTLNLPCNRTYRGPSNHCLLLGFGRSLLIQQHKQGVLNMATYTIATRDTIAQQFVPVSKFRLMSLSDAQVVAQELRAAGYDAVAFNTQAGV